MKNAIAELGAERERLKAAAKPESNTSQLQSGKCYSLKSITLEITDEPVTTGRVEKVLGWLSDPSVMSNPGWKNLPIDSRRAISQLLTKFPDLKGDN